MFLRPASRASSDEHVGGDGEDFSRFPHATEVHDEDEHDRQHAEHGAVREQTRDGGGDRGDAGRDADGDGQHIVDHQ